jgi:ABC-type proline/glycine betaine transport system permease subunit
MQNIRKMIIHISINDNFFILYFHLNFDTNFEQYREHYVQIHEIVSNESNFIKDINYAINRFLNICVNRLILKKSTFVMIVITFVLNFFFNKISLNAQLKIENVIIIIIKMCIICEKKYHTTSEHREQFNLKRNHE